MRDLFNNYGSLILGIIVVIITTILLLLFLSNRKVSVIPNNVNASERPFWVGSFTEGNITCYYSTTTSTGNLSCANNK